MHGIVRWSVVALLLLNLAQCRSAARQRPARLRRSSNWRPARLQGPIWAETK
jgi:hypothetical protein